MRILLWHVHGSWTTAFVQGSHEYLLPVLPDRGPDGRGRARTWDWPASVREVAPEEMADLAVDCVLLQRPNERGLVGRWTGRHAGHDVPAVYLEHNTPGSDVPFSRHPMADDPTIPIVHVTHFNRLFWDCGSARTMVIEHGIVDPGYHYTGEIPRAAVVVNDPVRRGRAVGTDLIVALADAIPVDVFGMGAAALVDQLGRPDDRIRAFDDLPQQEMHQALARRRVYVHTARWTSLGLSLLEAMHLGMPVVAVAATEAVRAVPADAGVVTTEVAELLSVTVDLADHVGRARELGRRGRATALAAYGLGRFLADWDGVLEGVVSPGGQR